MPHWSVSILCIIDRGFYDTPDISPCTCLHLVVMSGLLCIYSTHYLLLLMTSCWSHIPFPSNYCYLYVCCHGIHEKAKMKLAVICLQYIQCLGSILTYTSFFRVDKRRLNIWWLVNGMVCACTHMLTNTPIPPPRRDSCHRYSWTVCVCSGYLYCDILHFVLHPGASKWQERNTF